MCADVLFGTRALSSPLVFDLHYREAEKRWDKTETRGRVNSDPVAF